jgi:hypothetical protein
MAKEKPLEGEILEPEHAYNDSSLNSKDFMLAVMHDKRVPLQTRLDAASKVSAYEHPRLAQVNQDVSGGLTITINGGLPALPGTNIIMPKGSTAETPKLNGGGPA